MILIVVLAVVSALGITFLNENFIIVLSAYLILNILYSLYLKNIVIVDIISIAAGFMLRVIAGGVAIDVYISKWLLLTTLFISLFLAVMKRRAELNVIQNENNTRKVLEEYSIGFVDQIAAVTAAGVIICYALYTVAERTISIFHTERLLYTSIFVIFGIFRYMYLVFNKKKGENTAEILISDLPMIINILLYGLVITYLIYFG
jgi:4-hydroxybenzoate polyprenyltransferase